MSVRETIQAQAERSVWAALKRLEESMSPDEAAILLHRCTGIALCATFGHREASEHAYAVADNLATLMSPK